MPHRRYVLNPLRDAANIIADAVVAAKDEEIRRAEAALAEARREAKKSRVELARAARTLKTVVEGGGDAFTESVDDMGRDVRGK